MVDTLQQFLEPELYTKTEYKKEHKYNLKPQVDVSTLPRELVSGDIITCQIVINEDLLTLTINCKDEKIGDNVTYFLKFTLGGQIVTRPTDIPTGTKLATPFVLSEISVFSIVKYFWEAIPNAQGYDIRFYQHGEKVGSGHDPVNSYQPIIVLDYFFLDREPGEYQLTVQAISYSPEFLNSDESEPLTITIN